MTAFEGSVLELPTPQYVKPNTSDVIMLSHSGVLTSRGQAPMGSRQPHVGLPAERRPALLQGAGIDAQAHLQQEIGLQPVAKGPRIP